MTQPGYQVIARRWRPKTFTELVGQEHIVKLLTNAIKSSRIAHAYLFVGPRGTGKTTTARLLAKSLNCTGGPSITPPEDCPVCERISLGQSLDVVEIDGASNNSVDQIRELREDCQYAPAEGKYKIYIIDEVHMLSTAAFNALLKTLEEPPSHVKFIFATTEAHKVLPTIVSRCQRLEFRPIKEEVIVAKLKEICQAEKVKVEEAALRGIARMAHGGMRDAQSILDQLISFCGNNLSEKQMIEIYGLASEKEVEELLDGVIRGDFKQVLELSERFESEGKDLLRIVEDVRCKVQLLTEDVIKKGSSLEISGKEMDVHALLRIQEAFEQCEESLKSGMSERVNFEVALLQATERAHSRSIQSVIKELKGLSREVPTPVQKKSLVEKEVLIPPKAELKEEPKLGKVTEVEDLVKKLPKETRDILEDRFRGVFRERKGEE